MLYTFWKIWDSKNNELSENFYVDRLRKRRSAATYSFYLQQRFHEVVYRRFAGKLTVYLPVGALRYLMTSLFTHLPLHLLMKESRKLLCIWWGYG